MCAAITLERQLAKAQTSGGQKAQQQQAQEAIEARKSWLAEADDLPPPPGRMARHPPQNTSVAVLLGRWRPICRSWVGSYWCPGPSNSPPMK